jgi:3-hydroxyisobutyrate dehydrogenase-like beta-hydroxyacid dehydrogenase
MGIGYARNLIAGGHPVTGYDVADEPMTTLAGLGGTPASSNAAVASSSDVVLVALAEPSALRDAVDGPEGLAEGARPGLVVVEMGTFPLDLKMWVRNRLTAVGAEVLDAPVSGTGLQAEAGEVVVYASGEPEAIQRARPVFDALGKACYEVGPFGNGSKMKYLANLLVSVHNLATAEVMVLASAAGLDLARVLEVIAAGVGSSRIFEIRGPMMAAGDYPPSARLEMFLKDIDAIARFADDLGVPTPLLDASLPWYQAAVEAGLGDQDAAALARLLADRVSPPA